MPVATLDGLPKANAQPAKRGQPSLPLFKEDPNDTDFTPDKVSEGEGDDNRAPAERRRSSRPKPEIVHLPLEDPSPPAKRARFSSSMSPRGKRSNGQILGSDPTSSEKPADSMGLDRKAMEQERLARLAARAANDERPRKMAKTEAHTSSTSAPPQNPNLPLSQPSMSGAIQDEFKITQPPTTTPPSPTNIQMPDLPYPNGAIKSTWAFAHDRHNDIKIEEVLQKNKLRIAVLSSWQIDMEWITSKLDMTKTKLMLVMECKYEEDKAQWRQECQQWSKSLRLCFPPMGKGPYERMHSKLMLLFYPDYLRVVVPSANLMAYDWGETGVMENTVFLVDLPRLSEDSRGTPNNATRTTPFARELLRFLDAIGMEEDVKSGVQNFDFSKTSHLAFIHSISGSYHGEEAVKSTGYPLFASSVKELGLAKGEDTPSQIDVLTSSMGALTNDRVEALYAAFSGRHNFASNKTSTSKVAASDSSSSAKPAKTEAPLKDCFRIFFPSAETIKKSKGGPNSAGTIFLTSSTWNKAGFPQHLFRDSVSSREGLLSHCKMILARTPSTSYVYTGSANLSQSAWGNLTWDRKAPGGAKWKLNVSNWECGVLMGLRGGSGTGEEAGNGPKNGLEVMSMKEAFGGMLDVPLEWPGKTYQDGEGGNEGLVPWMQKGAF